MLACVFAGFYAFLERKGLLRSASAVRLVRPRGASVESEGDELYASLTHSDSPGVQMPRRGSRESAEAADETKTAGDLV